METTALNEQAVKAFRHTYYSLFVRLLWREPPAEFITALQEEMAERIEAATSLHPLMGEGWKVIQRYLAAHPPEQVAEEFTRLFLGPDGPEVNPYESYYLTGQLFRGPLVALRSFLRRLGLEKQESDFAEPEDVLAFELEVMRWLVHKQMAAENAEEEACCLQFQTDFLREHLLVWAPTCAQDIAQAQNARFYRGLALILQGFLEVEYRLFQDRGLHTLRSLQEARQQYGAIQTWKGPTFAIAEEAATGSSTDKTDVYFSEKEEGGERL